MTQRRAWTARCALWLCTQLPFSPAPAAAQAPVDVPDVGAALDGGPLAGEESVGFGGSPAPGEPGSGEEGLGFAPPTGPVAELPAGPRAWTLSGTARLQAAMRLERSGAARLGKLRQVLGGRLEYDHDFASLPLRFRIVASGRGEADYAYLLRRDAYDAPTVDVYGANLIWGETYLSLSSNALEISFGEQIVNFGQGEVLGVLDLINPRDMREPLYVQADELHLPVLMTRASLTVARVRAELAIVHEPYFGLRAPPLGEFNPTRKLLLQDATLGSALEGRALYNRHFPGRTPFQNGVTQVHARIAWSVARFDLALHAATLLDGLGVPSLPAAAAFAGQRIDLPIYHPRYELVGHSGAFSVGPLVVRWEGVIEVGRPHTVRTGGVFGGWTMQRANTLRALLGLTYVPSTTTSVGLELQPTLVAGPLGSSETDKLLLPVTAPQIALRADHRFLRDRAYASLLLFLIGVGHFNAFGARAELGYAVLDPLKVTLGVVTYLPSADFGPFYGFERNDRMYCNWRWDFAAE